MNLQYVYLIQILYYSCKYVTEVLFQNSTEVLFQNSLRYCLYIWYFLLVYLNHSYVLFTQMFRVCLGPGLTHSLRRVLPYYKC